MTRINIQHQLMIHTKLFLFYNVNLQHNFGLNQPSSSLVRNCNKNSNVTAYTITHVLYRVTLSSNVILRNEFLIIISYLTVWAIKILFIFIAGLQRNANSNGRLQINELIGFWFLLFRYIKKGSRICFDLTYCCAIYSLLLKPQLFL